MEGAKKDRDMIINRICKKIKKRTYISSKKIKQASSCFFTIPYSLTLQDFTPFKIPYFLLKMPLFLLKMSHFSLKISLFLPKTLSFLQDATFLSEDVAFSFQDTTFSPL